MKKPARPRVVSCVHCAHFAWKKGAIPKRATFSQVASCANGHRPTFVLPDMSDTKPWGYRRACSDFRRNTHGQGADAPKGIK
jgi:hypothetical protein